ncbi:MAG: HAD hydrolase-like protein [bacterium]|nr:HAD hydrolase-like protein [bacterium]
MKAIIFDWGRTLFDSETKNEFPEAEEILVLCRKRGYRLAVASLVSIHANASLEERTKQIENSPLRKFFEVAAVTDEDKDKILDEVVAKLDLPREEILIVDDRIIRGIKYGNLRNHPTVWLQKGKFENELPNEETKTPTFIIHSLSELTEII